MLLTSYKELNPELRGLETLYVGVIREGVNFTAPVIAMTLPTPDIDKMFDDLNAVHDILALQANPTRAGYPEYRGEEDCRGSARDSGFI